MHDSGPQPRPRHEAEALALLAQSPLLAGLDDQQREEFVRDAAIIHLDEPGAMLVREGEDAVNFYIVLAGEAEVFKHEGGRDFPLTTLGPGDYFGETALFRDARRTASIRARTPMTLAMIEARELREAPGAHGWAAGFLLELMRQGTSRLDRLSKTTVQGLRAELDSSRRRLVLNQLLIWTISSLALYAIITSFANLFVTHEVVRSLIGNGLYAAVGGALIWVMLSSPYPLSFFGVRLSDNPRRELAESLAVTVALVALLTGVKLALITTVDDLRGFELIPASTTTPFVELVFALFYLVFIPIQEMCVRGALQSSLEETFAGHERRVWLSILLSNALFVAVHARLSPAYALMLFVPGVLWGLLYARHRSLLGISISHVIVQLWALRVLGVGELPSVF